MASKSTPTPTLQTEGEDRLNALATILGHRYAQESPAWNNCPIWHFRRATQYDPRIALILMETLDDKEMPEDLGALITAWLAVRG